MSPQKPISDEQLKQFHEQGFFVLENVVPIAQQQMLREVCDAMIAQDDAKSKANGTPLTLKYFMSLWDEPPGKNPEKDECRTRAKEFVFGDLMKQITQTLLGDKVFLSFEQFVVKAAEKGAPFAWHQDSAYVSTPHPPYLTCWCTLDDVTEENGTVYMLPYDRAGTRDVLPHHRAKDDFDLIGYDGDDPGIPVIASAGSIACFSSHVLHRSGRNTTPNLRRVYLPQYSSQPILNEKGEPFYIAESFL